MQKFIVTQPLTNTKLVKERTLYGLLKVGRVLDLKITKFAQDPL
ncbi:uncharacterized protein METZ01_LOCUS242201 [marine metagenome]|uniref:Uncharacterized protein n=1 Tax=marine metagenome TaxID=408172 RepID=A0A382HQX8_9ZZZZ